MVLNFLWKSGFLEEPIKVSKSNAKDFKGEWLAIVDEKIVAHNKDAGKVIEVTKKHYKGKKPEFVRISGGNVAMY